MAHLLLFQLMTITIFLNSQIQSEGERESCVQGWPLYMTCSWLYNDFPHYVLSYSATREPAAISRKRSSWQRRWEITITPFFLSYFMSALLILVLPCNNLYNEWDMIGVSCTWVTHSCKHVYTWSNISSTCNIAHVQGKLVCVHKNSVKSINVRYI